MRCYIYLHIEPESRIIESFFGFSESVTKVSIPSPFTCSVHLTSFNLSSTVTFLFSREDHRSPELSSYWEGTVSVVPVNLTDTSSPYRFFLQRLMDESRAVQRLSYLKAKVQLNMSAPSSRTSSHQPSTRQSGIRTILVASAPSTCQANRLNQAWTPTPPSSM